MNITEFAKLVGYSRERQDKILDAKGRDYTVGNLDRLYNFKFIAELTGLTPLQVWAVYWLKHVLAVVAYTKNQTESEPIEGRIDDATNYLLLLEGLLADAGPKPDLDLLQAQERVHEEHTRVKAVVP